MPDKHEVGGSSPLGPTSELRFAKNHTDLCISTIFSGGTKQDFAKAKD